MHTCPWDDSNTGRSQQVPNNTCNTSHTAQPMVSVMAMKVAPSYWQFETNEPPGKTGHETKYDTYPLHQKRLECRHLGFEQWVVGKVCRHNQFDATRNLLCWRHTQISRNPDLFDLVSLVGLRLAADTIAGFCCYVCWMLMQSEYVAWSSTARRNGRAGAGALLLPGICVHRHLIYR